MSPTHWLIVVGVLVLLFGASRLPNAARSLGRSARILKSEVRELSDSEKPGAEKSGTGEQAQVTRAETRTGESPAAERAAEPAAGESRADGR